MGYILFFLLIVLVLAILNYRGKKINSQFIQQIVDILNSNDKAPQEKIDEAKTLCRWTKGILSYAIYEVLTVWERSIMKNN